MARALVIGILAEILACTAGAAVAHSGRTNPAGCHKNKKTHSFHCHNSPSFSKSSAPQTVNHASTAKPRTTTSSAGGCGVRRDADGDIKRSSAVKNKFRRMRRCTTTGKRIGPCSGYVIDHRVLLKRGGLDAPSNMQWQTTRVVKAKHKWE